MNWKTELAIGAVLIVIGAFLIYQFNVEFITVIEGAVPLLMLILGALFLWIAYEDKIVEAELKKIEKELEKESSEKSSKSSETSS